MMFTKLLPVPTFCFFTGKIIAGADLLTYGFCRRGITKQLYTKVCFYDSGPYIARRQRGQLPPPGKLIFFSNIVFEYAELFLVAILLRNHKKINVNSK